jgi:hypothetical protein
MAFLDISRTDKLARQQRIEQSTQIHSEIVLDELRVEFCVVRDLDWSWSFENSAQWCEGIALRRVAVSQMIEVEDENSIVRRELD